MNFATIHEVFSSRVVGWSLSTKRDAEFKVRALQMVVRTLLRAEQVILYSNHGSQYTSQKFRQAWVEAIVKVSIGPIEDCFDNAMTEKLRCWRPN
ncbi:MAG: DDE-type integrase/transposase/recombinase [Gammaproteobacteria bacterium]|nr:DDE-type integrase/transposase/recombinase [Gammaproteobacteria bacterium]